MSKQAFAILGAGISGITVGNILLDRFPDAKVTMYASQTSGIVSYIAIAQFYPIFFGDEAPPGYDEKAKAWILKSKEEFTKRIGVEYGIAPKRNYELFKEKTPAPAYFYEALSNFSEKEDPNLPLDYNYMYEFDNMIVDAQTYVAKLLKDFLDKGGNLMHQTFRDLNDVSSLSESTIFNCTGLGSRALFGDNELKPVKGHIIRMQPLDIGNKVVSAGEFIIAERTRDLCIGCLYREKFDTEEPTQEEQDYLFDHVKAIVETPNQPFSIPPGSLKKKNIIKSVTGMRPLRSTGLRVEKERVGNKTIIHNYGHGGSGVIYSWGTADEAVGLLEQA